MPIPPPPPASHEPSDIAIDLGRALNGPVARFLAVGVVGLTVDVATFKLIVEASGAEWLARLASLTVATVTTFSLNRRFTFAASTRTKAADATRYAGVALAGQGLNYGQFLAIRALLPSLPPIVALLISAATTAVATYGGQRFFTFSTPAETR